MRNTRFLKISLLITLSICSFSSLTSEEALSNVNDYTVSTGNQCFDPKVQVSIAPVSGKNEFNVTTIIVPKNTCVNINFPNSDIVEHTITIDAVASDNISFYNLYISTAMFASQTFLTPNKDGTYQFYCAVPGHRAAGEFGDLVVGTDTPSTQNSQNSVNTSKSNSTNTISTSDFSLSFSILGMLVVVLFLKKGKRSG